MKKMPAVFCWSGGKDSAYALYKALQQDIYDIKYLLSTINGNYKRLSMHGVREELIEMQATNIGIPLIKVYVYEASNEEYEKQMNNALLALLAEGINTVLYGDIFLEDLRAYREEKMAAINMSCVFPIWQMDTQLLLQDFVLLGFKTLTCCVNAKWLDQKWAGRLIDEEFIKQLPPQVDPCGENGEYHSFCFDGPIFKKPLQVSAGEEKYQPLLLNESNEFKHNPGFWFADIIFTPQ